LLEVVRILHELDDFVALELGDLERTRADRLGPHLAAVGVASVDRRVARGEHRQERALRALELERDLKVAVDDDVLDVLVPDLARALAYELGLVVGAVDSV